MVSTVHTVLQVQHGRAPRPDELLPDGRGHGEDHQEVLQLPGQHQDLPPVLLPPHQQGHPHARSEVAVMYSSALNEP